MRKKKRMRNVRDQHLPILDLLLVYFRMNMTRIFPREYDEVMGITQVPHETTSVKQPSPDEESQPPVKVERKEEDVTPRSCNGQIVRQPRKWECRRYVRKCQKNV